MKRTKEESKSLERIEDIYRERFDYVCDIGYRFLSSSLDDLPKIGDQLQHSFVWVDGDWTDEELPGTCAFGDLTVCLDYAEWDSGWIIVIGGSDVGSGEEPGEILIDDAVVISVLGEVDHGKLTLYGPLNILE